MARILLVPGFWLGAWAWDEVTADLRQRGNEVTALTPRGLDPADPDRLSVTLEQQATGIIDAAPAGAKTVLVVHSGAAVTGYLATDLAPERFERVIYTDSWPPSPGFAVNPELDPAVREWPLPEWSVLDEGEGTLDGLTETMLATFRERAVSEPAALATTPVQLSDRTERLAIPTTVICSTFTAELAKKYRDAGEESMFAELARLDAEYIDLPTSHWPMFSKPAELAEVIHTAANR